MSSLFQRDYFTVQMAFFAFSSLATLGQIIEAFDFISAAGKQTALLSVEIGQRSKAVVFKLINPLGALKEVATANWDGSG
jgi:hypothetical protein